MRWNALLLGIFLTSCGAAAVPDAPASPPSSESLVALVRNANFDVEACRGMPNAPTLGAQYVVQVALLSDEPGRVHEGGTCSHAEESEEASPNAVWRCMVIATPSDERGAAIEDASNFSVVFDVDADGAIIQRSPLCLAAG